jgi:hypothetical protein
VGEERRVVEWLDARLWEAPKTQQIHCQRFKHKRSQLQKTTSITDPTVKDPTMKDSTMKDPTTKDHNYKRSQLQQIQLKDPTMKDPTTSNLTVPSQ